ncbi:unnamed protein product [Withania somnifera]
MEGLSVSSTSLYCGLKGYWSSSRRRGYERLRKNHVEYKRLRFWKIKLSPRLKLKVKFRRFSPKRLLMNMRDGYVNMMMKMANTRCMSSGISGFDGGFGNRQLKEYDEKVLVEIYKSMIIAQGQLVPRNVAGAAKFRTQICANSN